MYCNNETCSRHSSGIGWVATDEEGAAAVWAARARAPRSPAGSTEQSLFIDIQLPRKLGGQERRRISRDGIRKIQRAIYNANMK